MTTPQGSYDAVVIGAGPVGVNIAKVLTDRGKRVLLLEAGRASGLSYDGWLSYVDTFRSAVMKEPNAPYPPNPNAPKNDYLVKTEWGRWYVKVPANNAEQVENDLGSVLK